MYIYIYYTSYTLMQLYTLYSEAVTLYIKVIIQLNSYTLRVDYNCFNGVYLICILVIIKPLNMFNITTKTVYLLTTGTRWRCMDSMPCKKRS